MKIYVVLMFAPFGDPALVNAYRTKEEALEVIRNQDSLVSVTFGYREIELMKSPDVRSDTDGK